MITDAGDLGPNARRLWDRVNALLFGRPACVDVGVRDGVSSSVMLDALRDRDGMVVGIDAARLPDHLVLDPQYLGIQNTDSVTALINFAAIPIHAAWIDTIHCAHQSAVEAALIWQRIPVGGFIGFHDTHWPKGKCDHYCGRDWPTPDVAVKWLFAGRDYAEVEEFPESWGAMFVTKLNDSPLELTGITWDEIFEGRNTLLAVLPDKVKKRAMTPEEAGL